MSPSRIVEAPVVYEGSVGAGGGERRTHRRGFRRLLLGGELGSFRTRSPIPIYHRNIATAPSVLYSILRRRMIKSQLPPTGLFSALLSPTTSPNSPRYPPTIQEGKRTQLRLRGSGPISLSHNPPRRLLRLMRRLCSLE